MIKVTQHSQGYRFKKQARAIHPSIILLYHRVADLSFDPQLLSVSTRNFEEQMEVISKYARPMSLRALRGQLMSRQGISSGVVVTFDDGYADNLWNALPILTRFGVPATVFNASGYVGGDREFWWDELEQILFEPKHLASHLSLRLANGTQRFVIGQTSPGDCRFGSWNITAVEDPTGRHKLYRELFDLLRPLIPMERLRILKELAIWAKGGSVCRESHRPLTSQELENLSRCELIEIGAHTMTHPVLEKLNIEQQTEEIDRSRKVLEELIDERVTSFSYPFGTRHDYSQETVSIVRGLGFELACANAPGIADSSADLFQMPRFIVRDWDGGRLLRFLTEIGVVC